jgi:hypothetical protein
MSVLEEKKNVTLNSIKEVTTKISDLETQVCTIVRDKNAFLSLKNQSGEFSKGIERAQREITYLNRKITPLLSEKKKIIDIITKRAELRGIPPVLDNKKLRELDFLIFKYKGNIEEQNASIKAFQYKLTNGYSYDYRSKEKEIATIQNNITKLYAKRSRLQKDADEIYKLLLEDTLRPQYEKYAVENEIEYDENDDFDIFRQCNTHHHYQLLNGYETYTKCYKSFRECSGDVVLSVEYNIYGIYGICVSGTCECGFGSWDEETPPENLKEFNLNSTHVYGNMN